MTETLVKIKAGKLTAGFFNDLVFEDHNLHNHNFADEGMYDDYDDEYGFDEYYDEDGGFAE